MILDHITGMFTHPDKEWFRIRSEKRSKLSEFLQHTPFVALIPTVAFYLGVTQTGWKLPGDHEVVRLTVESALPLCVLSYIAALAGVWIFAEFINWMHDTYSEEETDTHHGMALSVYVTTPIFLAGIAGLWPDVWLNGFVMMLAGAYSVYLIYEGLPILMNIPKERAFMYATSVITVALVLLVTMRIGTVIVWVSGFGPQYI
ncbi:MAG: YIP1 family protein [Pseudomonadales bacterium]|nr:YIP1 family protein [Pseudomonadales bacterium]